MHSGDEQMGSMHEEVAGTALADPGYRLDDNLKREQGRVFLTGTQALIRLPLMQKALDERAGLNTGGFISGYRGSPLGAVDQEAWRASTILQQHAIEFLPVSYTHLTLPTICSV